MAFTPQNFIDKVGPVVSAQFLNGLDQTCNQGLNGLTTQAAIAAWLGVPGPGNVISIAGGGTGQTTAAAALAALGGIGPIPQTPAEAAAGVAVTDGHYPPGCLLRYGIIPNSPAAAAQNQSTLGALLKWNVLNGPTGLIYSPNTGATSGPDTYYFSDDTNLIRDGITLDLCGTTWNFVKTSAYSDDNNGFLWCMRDVTIQNGRIIATYNDGGGPGTGGTNPGPGGTQQPGGFGVFFFGGRDAPVLGSNLPTIFDSQLTPFVNYGITMGNITLKNLYISGTCPFHSFYGVLSLGGLNNVTIENVTIEGNGDLVNGVYYEFGWATNGSTHTRQTSHAHNWHIKNFIVRNTSSAQQSDGGFGSNGGYNFLFENVSVSNAPTVIGCSTGESAFFRPWVGVDDLGSLPQNGQSPLTGTAAAGRTITMRNVTGRQISGTAYSVGGATVPSAFHGAPNLLDAWQPNTVYTNGDIVYNGSYKFTCTVGGTSSNAAGFTGPRGTSGSITDGSVTWTYTASAGGTGYNGYQSTTAYGVNDIVFNGQYLYLCTTAGVSSASSQGPTGVGTGIVGDGTLRWSSIPSSSSTGVPANSAWPACTDQLNMILDGFTADSGTSGGASGGYGVTFTGGIASIRNGKVTNMNRGVSIGGDCTQVTIDSVIVLNCGGAFGMQISGPTPSAFTPARLMQGAVRNCFIAGSSTNGVAPGYGIILSQCQSFLIENNRFGYETIHDGIAEPTQQYAVFLPVFSGSISPYSGVICRSNYVNCAAGGFAYYLYSGSNSYNCAIDDPVGPVQTYSGAWEGVLQSTTPALTCATPGDLSVAYTVQALDYIKRGQKIDFSLEIVTSSFTWTTASGNVRVTGLPYNANNSVVGSLPMMSLGFQGITKAGYTQFTPNSSGGISYLSIACSGSGQTEATLQISDMPTAGSVKLQIAGFYFTN
jgi:hypothetical protein